MAEVNSTPELKFTRHTNLNIWVGSSDQLINAGLVDKDMLPGQPGRNRFSVTFNGKPGRQEYGENYLSITKLSKNKFRLRKGLPSKERKAREEKHDVEMEAFKNALIIARCAHDGSESMRNRILENIKQALLLIEARVSGFTMAEPQKSLVLQHLAKAYLTVEKAPVKIDNQLMYRQISKHYSDVGLEVPEMFQPKLKLVK